MLEVSKDLKVESDIIFSFLDTLQPQDWKQNTDFKNWSPWDVIAHLHYFDQVSMAALLGKEKFEEEKRSFIASLKKGQTNQEIAAERFRDTPGNVLLNQWHSTITELSDSLGNCDPEIRLPWFGPDMGLRMFTTARFMETWAHVQTIYDLKETKREYTDRIKNVALIGIKTYGWTFLNRKIDVPGEPPYVKLHSPSGTIWEWNEPNNSNYIKGNAIEFCFVVTQVRNVLDTDLIVKGKTAEKWMSIAQCFAGPVVDPPKPGTRGIRKN